jgi:hypothetical protein
MSPEGLLLRGTLMGWFVVRALPRQRTFTKQHKRAIYWPNLSSHGRSASTKSAGSFCNAMPKNAGKKRRHHIEGCEPSTLFREFAAECMELAQTVSSPEKHALYLKMTSVWFQMAQRWEKKLAAPSIETNSVSTSQELITRTHHKLCWSKSRHAFVGHSYDRARDRVYHSLLLLGPHSGHWRRALDRFLRQS